MGLNNQMTTRSSLDTVNNIPDKEFTTVDLHNFQVGSELKEVKLILIRDNFQDNSREDNSITVNILSAREVNTA